MIQFAKDLADNDAPRMNDTPKTDALIELDDSVLDQIGGVADPMAKSRLLISNMAQQRLFICIRWQLMVPSPLAGEG
jgi:hypothetical protein